MTEDIRNELAYQRIRLTFEQVSAVAYPQYYRRSRPCVHRDHVSEKHWTRTSKVGGYELIDQYEGLLELERQGELIRDISLIREDDTVAKFARIVELEQRVDQLLYERRLLGFARRTLDAVADPDKRYTSDPVVHERLIGEAADVAQRIVDEIGHPATDEDAAGPSLRAEVARLQAVVDRVEMLAAWSDGGFISQRVRELLADERDNATLQAASQRTGHYLAHRCEACLAAPS